MNTVMRMTLTTAAVGLALASAGASAVTETMYNEGTAPRHCQAFTPGVTNTIRNRVTGAENVGGSPIAVACAFENVGSASASFTQSATVALYNGGESAATVTCSGLAGYFGATVGTVITKSVTIAPSAAALISISAADTPSTTDTDLGSWRYGMNCTIPTAVTMTWTRATWTDDDDNTP